MSSLKMTFSLTSLIFLIALGLVFVPTSVMAHDAEQTAAGTPAVTTDDIPTHDHPEKVGKDAVTSGPNQAGALPVHSAHPTVTISLAEDMAKVKGTEVIVMADDGEAANGMENVVNLVVQFNVPIHATSSGAETAIETDLTDTAALLATTDFTVVIRDNSRATPATGVVVVSVFGADTATELALDTVKRMEAAGMGSKFVVPLKIPTAALPNGMAGDDKEKLHLIIKVNKGAGYGLQKSLPPDDPLTVDDITVPGGESQASAVETFTLVKAFTDNTPPMMRITPPEMLDAGKLVFTIDVDKALGTGPSGLQLSDFDIAGGTGVLAKVDPLLEGDDAPDKIGERAVVERYTLTVTPDPMMDHVLVTVSLREASVSDAAGRSIASTMATYDKTPPTVTITAPDKPDGDGNLTFTFVFSEPIVGFEAGDIRGSGFSIVASVPKKMSTDTTTMTETWTVKVTPTAPDAAVTVAISAGAVDDKNGNTLATGTTATYTPAEPEAPAAPANLEAIAGEQIVTLKWTVVAGASYQYRKKSGDAAFKADGSDYMDATLVAVAGDATKKMIEVTGLTGGTEYTFQVRVKADGNVPAGTAASATATPKRPAETASATFSHEVPAKSYVIVARTDSPDGLPRSALPENPDEKSSDTTIEAWSTMPNLEDLFYQGGSLLLTTSNTTKLNRTGDADTANDEVAKERDVMITEIMAARNTAKVGQDGYLAHQWIELYNKLPVAVTVTLSHKSGTPPPGPASGEAKLDLVSNVVTNARWEFTGLGQDGSVGGGEGTDKSFVSFYRNRGENGQAKGHWKTSTETYLSGDSGTHVGTPGAEERKASKAVAKTTVPYKNVIINEVGNLSGKEYDWIELRNVSDGNVNIKNWHIGSISAKGDDKILVKFPDDDHYTIKANSIILVVATDPYDDPDHPILAGKKWNKGQERLETPGATSTYYVASGGNDTLDNDGLGDGNYNLVLRSGYDKNKPDEKIIDITGAKKISDIAFDTIVWPLKGAGAPHGDVFHDALPESFKDNNVYHRNNAGAGFAEHNWTQAGFTGFGYKRGHEKGSKGSPGYAHDIKEKSSDLADASVSISEIMYETNSSKSTAQWIELYNNSATQAVNLNEWKLKFENADDADIRKPAVTTNNLPGKILLPKQTVLIVSRKTGSVSRVSLGDDDFPDTRIINLYDQKDKLEVTTQNYKLLSTTAFRITLMQKGGDVVDTVGNMDDEGMAMWALPASEKGEGRSSIIRRYGDKDIPLDGTLPAWFGVGSIRGQGKEGLTGGEGEAGWVFAANTSTSRGLYYGRRTDRGTPGFRGTGPLPVQLSKFRPERLESGEIVIRWITESELNNAGFNILRSDTRDGQYKQINTQLIKGKGTTSERHTYEWKDTTAKPNVIYYYQIQDVSLDGKVQTLRMSRLKGHVSPAGKLTTTWGELKALQ